MTLKQEECSVDELHRFIQVRAQYCLRSLEIVLRAVNMHMMSAIVAVVIVAPVVLQAGTVETNEPCAAEMHIVREMEAALRSGDTNRCHVVTQAKFRTMREWNSMQGVTIQHAGELIQYLSTLNKAGICTRIEIRLADGNRGVVAEIIEGKTGIGEYVTYVFRYGGVWHELASVGVMH